MTTVIAAVTEDARDFHLQMIGGLILPGTSTTPSSRWDPNLKFFRVGEGGWQTSGLSQIQRPPVADLRRYDNSVHDIDARVDTTRAAASQPERYPGDPMVSDYSRGYYQKALASGDVTRITNRRILVTCTLLAGEFNEDYSGSARNPLVWEVGLFADHPTVTGESLMVAYGTLPVGILKTAAAPLSLRVFLTL